MEKLQVKLTGKTVTADVIRHNSKTVIVRLPDGRIIKRHLAKHIK